MRTILIRAASDLFKSSIIVFISFLVKLEGCWKVTVMGIIYYCDNITIIKFFQNFANMRGGSDRARTYLQMIWEREHVLKSHLLCCGLANKWQMSYICIRSNVQQCRQVSKTRTRPQYPAVEDRDSLEQNPAKSSKLKNSSCQDFFNPFLTEMYPAMTGRNW